MNSVLVVGYGNILRGDDAAGIRAAEAIAQQLTNIKVLCVHQLMPEIAEEISKASLAFFLDAEIGISSLVVRSVEPATESTTGHSHFATPQSLLTLSRELYNSCPHKTFLIGIPAFSLDFSDTMTAQTSQWVEVAVEEVRRILQNEFQ